MTVEGLEAYRLSDMQALESTIHENREEDLEEVERQNAAIRIQKAWRKHMRKKYLQPDFLWSDLATHARMQVRRHRSVCQACLRAPLPTKRHVGRQGRG